MHTVKVKQTSLSPNDDKRLKTYDGITTYPYGINTFIVCKSELDHYLKLKKWNHIKNCNKCWKSM